MKDNIFMIPVLGKAFETERFKGVYAIKEKAVVGRLYQMECPVCNKVLLLKAKEAKPWIEHCKHCGTKIFIQGRATEPAKPKVEQPQLEKKLEQSSEKPNITDKVRTSKNVQTSGKLVWGNMFRRKSCLLHEGENYIGRCDNSCPSDVSINDDYVSRRSILIEVEKSSQGKGYTYKLTVKKCTNPVLINGKAQEVGNGIFLNFGDTIRVGNTILTFKPANQK